MIAGSGTLLESAQAEVLARVRLAIAERLARRSDPNLGAEDRAWIENLVAAEIEGYHSRAPHVGKPVLDSAGYSALARAVLARVTPLGPLSELMADPIVEEVFVNGPDEVMVVRDGRSELADLRFASEEDLLQTVRRMIGDSSGHLDRAAPMVTATLADGSRLNAVLPPVSLPLSVTIRRHQVARFTTLSALARCDTLPWELIPWLKAAVRAKLNLIISGGTGTGKTTLLRVMIGEVDPGDRLITIEDQRELHLHTAADGRPNCISLEARDPNTEGAGGITIQQLVRNALRQRPDRIFVGESRGPEALDVLDAMGTGHDGSATTLHANSVRDALTRLSALVRRNPAQAKAEPAAIAREIAAKVDLVIHLARFRTADGSDRRVVQAVGVVTGQVEADTPIVEDVLVYRRSVGQWQWLVGRFDDLPLKVADKFEAAGVSLDGLPAAG